MGKKETKTCAFEMDFKKFFGSVLIKVMMIYFLLMQQNNIFWSKIGPGFGEQGGTSPPRTPRIPLGGYPFVGANPVVPSQYQRP